MIDPVGAYRLDDTLQRRESSRSRSWAAAAAAGTPAARLPAYRLCEPAAIWLRGYLDHVPHWHWQWQDPPDREQCSKHTPTDAR